MADEKWYEGALVLHEIERFVHIGVTLVYGSLAHLLDEFLPVAIIINCRVGDLLEAWSFVHKCYRDSVVGVFRPHISVS